MPKMQISDIVVFADSMISFTFLKLQYNKRH